MSSKVLFIFEGPKLEGTITNNLNKFFVNEDIITTCAYCTTIYKMYAEISEDGDLAHLIWSKKLKSIKKN